MKATERNNKQKNDEKRCREAENQKEQVYVCVRQQRANET